MSEFLSQTFYGNTIAQWAVAAGIAIVSVVVGKTVYWIARRVLHRAAKHTTTDLDDFLVDTIDEPVVVVVTVIGFWLAVQTLTLPPGLEQFLWSATQAALVLAVTWALVRLWDAIVGGVLAPLTASSDTDLDDQLLPIARRGGKGAIWVVGVIVALNNAGYDVMALIAGLGIGGLALAMAARDTVANVFGGFTIFTDRPFSTGDRIVISGYDGTVSEIGIRSTRLRTLAGREVSIPNSRFADSPVENISREPNRKIVLELGLTYDTSHGRIGRAMDLLREIVEAQGEDTEEKVVIGFNSFGDFALGITLIYYITRGADIMGVQTAVNLRHHGRADRRESRDSGAIQRGGARVRLPDADHPHGLVLDPANLPRVGSHRDRTSAAPDCRSVPPPLLHDACAPTGLFRVGAPWKANRRPWRTGPT
jgi:MscS family membrane protein